MSDFPKGGDIAATRAWLDKRQFNGLLVDWDAEMLLGADKSDISDEIGVEKCRRLWGLLNIARQSLPHTTGLMLNACHMQSQTVRRVTLSSTYADFRMNCANTFESELSKHGKDFKVYRLPAGVANISDRQLVSEDNYIQLREDIILNTSRPMPSLWLWSLSATAQNSPNDRDYGNCVNQSNPSLRGGSSISVRVKSIYGYRCLACNHDFQTAKSTIACCHILEIEEIRNLSDEDATKLARGCGLVDIDDTRNFIPLCGTCHIHFDDQRLGIRVKKDKYYWQMKESLEPISLPHSDQVYGTIKGKEIPFIAQARPPLELIKHRQVRYDNNISSRINRKKRNWEELDYDSFAHELRNANCSEEVIDTFWAERKIDTVVTSNRRPNKNSDWEQIEPPSKAHCDSATFWYNAKLCKFWIKLKRG